MPRSIAIPVICDELRFFTNYFICYQFPLVLLWGFNIHGYKGKTLDMAVIDIRKIDKFCGITLVALS